MACPNLNSTLIPYLGNELIGIEKLQLEEHLASCSKCARAVETHRHNVGFIRSQNAEEAPASLKSSLKHSLDLSERYSRRKKQVFVMGMAAGVAMCSLVGYQWHRHSLRQSYERDAAMRHARQFPLEVLAAQNIEAWFGGKLDHPVMIPVFPNAQVAGARLLQVRDKTAAYIRYDGVRPMGLFIFGDDHEVGLNDDEPEVSISNGFHVVSWRQGDLVYQLVTDLDEQELVNHMVPARHQLMPNRVQAMPASFQH
jgi:anti-sigma factor RsiW